MNVLGGLSARNLRFSAATDKFSSFSFSPACAIRNASERALFHTRITD